MYQPTSPRWAFAYLHRFKILPKDKKDCKRMENIKALKPTNHMMNFTW